jgi:hypothetical protein
MHKLPEIASLQASLNYWIDELTRAVRERNAERRELCWIWIARYQAFMYAAIDATDGAIR